MSLSCIVSRYSVVAFAVLALATSGACSSSKSSPSTNDAAADQVAPTDGGGLTLTSTAFSDGQTIPAAITCAGANMSPQLAWTAGPSGTLSYAVLLTDLSIGVIHWVIWDIPDATHALPAELPREASLTAPSGAKQAHHVPFFGTGDNGYRGPCPSGALHNYQFEVHALDATILPSVTPASTPPDVKMQVMLHSLAHGDLAGTSTASVTGQ